jgi:GNAT superfamily N-acetyltransferase
VDDDLHAVVVPSPAPEDLAMTAVHVTLLDPFTPRDLDELSDVLIDCVEGGASVSFMLPLTRERARAFWSGVAESAARGERVVLAARDPSGAILGTAQVVWSQAENQPHRGDLAKMLVHRRARRLGAGAALLAAAERHALAAGRTVLVLDTGTPEAARLYLRAGWVRVGEIPAYALLPDGRLCTTTIFYKALTAPPA